MHVNDLMKCQIGRKNGLFIFYFLFFIFYISTANYNQPIIVKIKNKK